MCLLFVAWQQHAKWSLILASNRDEFYHRPSQPAHFWAEQCNLLGGRDQERGGTWLAVSRQGRFAAVTNYREPGQAPGQLSRGHLVSQYVSQDEKPADYINRQHPSQYSGYNLLFGDANQLCYHSNRLPGAEPKQLVPGYYGLSNHLLDTPWPKVRSGKQAFQHIVEQPNFSVDQLFACMADNRRADLDQLPDTGIGLQAEHALSSRFIDYQHSAPLADYGTRTTTVVLMTTNGTGYWFERNHSAMGVNDAETLAFSW